MPFLGNSILSFLIPSWVPTFLNESGHHWPRLSSQLSSILKLVFPAFTSSPRFPPCFSRWKSWNEPASKLLVCSYNHLSLVEFFLFWYYLFLCPWNLRGPGSPWATARGDSSFWKVAVGAASIHWVMQYSCRIKCCFGSSTLAIYTCLAKLELGVQPLSIVANLADRSSVWQPGSQALPSLVSSEAGRGPGWIS